MSPIIKKLIIVISITTISISFSILIYFNSNYYSDKKAEIKMQEKLAELNSIEKIYVNEGVYIYEQDVMQLEYVKDKFGNSSLKHKKKGVKEYEIAFKSDKLIIFDESKNRKEEIYFKNKYIVSVSEKSCHYNFFIDKWLIKTINNDNLIEDVLLSKGYDKAISLFVEKDHYPRFWSYYGFQIIDDALGPDVNILLHKNISNYSLSFVPQYVSNSTYDDYIYDLKTYKD